jgi:peptidoglycan/xylan/chitin deacetylase (PgdA/CDA1 family)
MKTEFIMYHYVRDLANSNYPKIKGLDIEKFESQLNFLSKNYNVISIEEFHEGNYNSNKKSCVLTFDDGYIDHFDFVFDRLLKYNMKGAFYAPVDIIDSSKVLDVNKIHLILASASEDLILDRIKYHFCRLQTKNSIDYFIGKINTSSRYDTKKTIIIKRLLQNVLDLDLRSLICDKLLDEFVNKSEEELSRELYLNRDQISEMIDCGMHFGSHGKSHFWFNSLDQEQQEYEIKESIKFLNSIYKKDFLLTMCYPYGSYNENTLSLMKKYNFKLALTTIPKIYNSLVDDIHKIPRLDTNDYLLF